MEAQAIDLTGDCQLFFGPKREAVALAANPEMRDQWMRCVLSLSLCAGCLGS